MQKAAEEMRFEDAAELRDLIQSVRRIGERQKITAYGEEDRDVIVDRFKSWRFDGYQTPYENIPEFCYSATKTEVIGKDYSLVPSRYIEFVQAGEDEDYDAKMKQLQSELQTLLIQEQQSRADLLEVMKGLGYEIDI